jgi:iron complex outermembrane receptor protein
VNSGSENQADSFTSGETQGTSNVNLRGLGLSSTLVLINGRRQTIAYGSDAVAGVVDFILKKDFEGFEINAGYQTTAEDGQHTGPHLYPARAGYSN